MSCEVASFFRSHVRVVPPPANGSTVNPPVPETCALTSENVISRAFASLNGESFNITLRVEPELEGLDGEELLQPIHATETRATSSARCMKRIYGFLQKPCWSKIRTMPGRAHSRAGIALAQRQIWTADNRNGSSAVLVRVRGHRARLRRPIVGGDSERTPADFAPVECFDDDAPVAGGEVLFERDARVAVLASAGDGHRQVAGRRPSAAGLSD